MKENPGRVLRHAGDLMEKAPGMHIDQALIMALGLPSDAREWTCHREEEATYGACLNMLRQRLTTWSVTGFSDKHSAKERLAAVRSVAS